MRLGLVSKTLLVLFFLTLTTVSVFLGVTLFQNTYTPNSKFIALDSKVEGYNLEWDKGSSDLVRLISQFNILNPDGVILDQFGRSSDPIESIKIELHPGRNTPENISAIIGENEQVIQSVNLKEENNILFILLHIDSTNLQQTMDLEPEFMAKAISNLTLRALHFAAYGSQTINSETNQELNQLSNQLFSSTQEPYIKVVKTNNISSFFIHQLEKTFSLQVYAQQYCANSTTGIYGVHREVYRCNQGGTNCSSSIECDNIIPGDTCVPSYESACTETLRMYCQYTEGSGCEVYGQSTGSWTGSHCTIQSPGSCTLAGGAPQDCPSGQNYCGGCINGCRANTQDCNTWIEQECGEPPPSGGCPQWCIDHPWACVAPCGYLCETGSWVNGSCGGSGHGISCNATQRYQTRYTNSYGCAPVARCQNQSSCCQVGNWVSLNSCGGTSGSVSCEEWETLEVRSVTGYQCTQASARCVSDNDTCCQLGEWEDQACGQPNCPFGQRLQTRSVPGCIPGTETTQCVEDLSCLPRSWWQVQGGSTYAHQSDSSQIAIRSIVPGFTCQEPDCIPNLITELPNLFLPKTDGLLISGGGTIETDGYYTPRDLYVQGSQITRFRENYSYFYNRTDLGLNPVDHFELQATNAQKPVTSGIYFSNGNLTIREPWNIAEDEWYVIFVDGSITFTDPDLVEQLVTVEPGGFIAFISSQDILINPSVGNNDNANETPNLEGVFIADGFIRSLTNNNPNVSDKRFIGAGSFVGWTSIQLDRNFDDDGLGVVQNQTVAIETFIHRPDLVVHTPDVMLSARRIWQETN